MPVTLTDLDQFYCSEQYHRHPLARGIVHTDGVHYVEENGAAWLVSDILMQLAYNPILRSLDFVVIEFDPSINAVIYKDDDREVECQTYDLCDLEVPVKFYFTNGVLLLPSEY